MDSDEEQGEVGLLADPAGIKDKREVEAAKKRELDQQQQKEKGWDLLRGGEGENQPSKKEPAKRPAAGGPITFNKKGPPVFAKRSGAISKDGFPGMDDAPTISGFLSASGKDKSAGKEETKHVSKNDSAVIGQFSSNAKGADGADKPGSNMDFSKRPPMFTSTKKAAGVTKSNLSEPLVMEGVGAQNYDFSKMNMSAAAVKREHQEGDEDGEEGEGKPRQQREQQDGERRAPRERREYGESKEEGFELVKADKRNILANRGLKGDTAKTWTDPVSQDKKPATKYAIDNDGFEFEIAK